MRCEELSGCGLWLFWWWLIYDVVIEGVGLVSNYRAQIDEILSSSSYDRLIQRMKARLAEETSTSAERP